jgi:FkbM family methyltransferase
MKTIIECGANNGSTTYQLLDMFGDENVIVYAIEPTHELVSSQLYSKFGNDPRVRICQFAIDVQNTFKKFNVACAADWGCSSLHEFTDNIHELWQGRPDFEKTHEYYVPTITLYDFCNLFKIETIDYLWIDTQGNDFNVLLSLGDKIKDVKKGRCEVADNVELYKNTNNKKDVVKSWLESKGFSTNISSTYFEADIDFVKQT